MLTNEEKRLADCVTWVSGAFEKLKAMGLLTGNLIVGDVVYELTPKGKAKFDQLDCDINITDEELISAVNTLLHGAATEHKIEMFLALVAFRDERDGVRHIAETIREEMTKAAEEDTE